MVRNNVVIMVAKGAGWDSDSVSLAAFKKNLHTHTHFQCGKRMPLKERQLFGWLVKMAGRHCKRGRASGWGGTKLHPAVWEPFHPPTDVFDQIKPSLTDAAWNKNPESINSGL